MKFEDINKDIFFLVNAVQKLTNLSLVNSAESFPDINYWHNFDPKVYRSGKMNDWTANITISQLALIWLLHGKTSELLGYDINDLFLTDDGKVLAKIISSEDKQKIINNELLILVKMVVDQSKSYVADIYKLKEELILKEAELIRIIKDNIYKDNGIRYLKEEVDTKNSYAAKLEELLKAKDAKSIDTL